MADINTALIALGGVLVGGYVNSFLAEDFRRFRDSQALAGALAGELDSHGAAVSALRPALNEMLALVKSGVKFPMPEWPQPSSPIFDASVERIGLLGPVLAKKVAFVYEQIRAFRIAFHLLSKHHEAMTPEWRAAMVENCVDRIDSAMQEGGALIVSLSDHAKKYREYFKVAKWCVVVITSLGIGFFIAAAHYAGASDTLANCTTTFDRSTLHTVCR